MRYSDFLQKYVGPFQELPFIFEEELGYIVWRVGTGENVEILHIRAFSPGIGEGPLLIKKMLEQLKWKPPYHSVFSFVLDYNERAKRMYTAAGFQENKVVGLYAGGDCALFTAPFRDLCRLHLGE